MINNSTWAVSVCCWLCWRYVLILCLAFVCEATLYCVERLNVVAQFIKHDSYLLYRHAQNHSKRIQVVVCFYVSYICFFFVYMFLNLSLWPSIFADLFG